MLFLYNIGTVFVSNLRAFVCFVDQMHFKEEDGLDNLIDVLFKDAQPWRGI